MFGLPIFMPPGTAVGASSELQVQASTLSGNFEEYKVSMSVVDNYNPVVIYRTAKVNSLGCTPQVYTTGDSTLSGYDDMHVLAGNVLNGNVGLMFYGTGQASIPFQAGSMCAQGPVKRTPGQSAGGSPGLGTDCSGHYTFHLSHDFLQTIGLQAGEGLWCQYWSRDRATPFGSGLSDAVEVVFDP